MSFMQPEVFEDYYYEIETTNGTEIVLADLVGMKATVGDMKDYLEGKVQTPAMEANEDLPEEYFTKKGKPRILKPKKGWVCRMQAPGYTDSTEWSAFDSEIEALAHLLDMYGTSDDGPLEDWEPDVLERIKEIDPNHITLKCYEGWDAPKPEEGDYITEDYGKWYQYGKLVLELDISQGHPELWHKHVKAHMDKEQFWPNVWYQGERGDMNLLDLEKGGFANG